MIAACDAEAAGAAGGTAIGSAAWHTLTWTRGHPGQGGYRLHPEAVNHGIGVQQRAGAGYRAGRKVTVHTHASHCYNFICFGVNCS